MNQNHKNIIAGLLAAGLVVGCNSKMINEGAAPGVKVEDENAPYATLRMNSVNILDKSLQNINGRGKIAVESAGARRSPSGTLEVLAVLRNRTDYPLQIEGRATFYDANKFPAEGPTAWQRVHLPPNAIANYQEFSTKVDGIAYYHVEIREGR